ncbi:hypothetical protein Q0Z83_054270 [Actinoplanes sichuanensis]|uniref:Phage tail tape measure protein n=1 Tax=Actinoplanes sichuanensis TaxID=512349 RepID=A0ABW4A9J8_9ACTN|nr:hypothetical protein [Actinoplanes sichuanensis]BEL07236.1 hypothetical protein Q0Z83_054270 [Actinoplanes sichuanensis]
MPFLARLGGAIERFSAWIAQADKSGALANFMRDAADSLAQIWRIGGLALRIVGILFKPSQEASGGVLAGVETTLQRIHDWLSSPENQRKIEEFWQNPNAGAEKAVTERIPALGDAFSTVEGWINKLDSWGKSWENFSRHVNAVTRGLAAGFGLSIGNIVATFTNLPVMLLGALAGLVRQPPFVR